jgi:hypothetical protein
MKVNSLNYPNNNYDINKDMPYTAYMLTSPKEGSCDIGMTRSLHWSITRYIQAPNNATISTIDCLRFYVNR